MTSSVRPHDHGCIPTWTRPTHALDPASSARRPERRPAGLDRGIARMVRAGVWVKIRRGAYAVRKDWRALDTAGQHVVRTRAVMKQANTEVVASHISGLMVYDGPTWGLNLDSVDATRTDGRSGRAEAGVRQHRGKILEGDVVNRLGIAVMSAPRLVCRSPGCRLEAALVAVNHLLHAGHTPWTTCAIATNVGIDCWALHARHRHRAAPCRPAPGVARRISVSSPATSTVCPRPSPNTRCVIAAAGLSQSSTSGGPTSDFLGVRRQDQVREAPERRRVCFRCRRS